MLCVCSARSSCPIDPGQDLDVQEPGPGGQVLEAAEKLLLQHRRAHRSHIHVQSNRGIPLARAVDPELFADQTKIRETKKINEFFHNI